MGLGRSSQQEALEWLKYGEEKQKTYLSRWCPSHPGEQLVGLVIEASTTADDFAGHLLMTKVIFTLGTHSEKWKWKWSHSVQSSLFATQWTVAYQAPLSMAFSRKEYWNGLPFPSPEDLPHPGIKPGSPALQADALPSEPPGKSSEKYMCTKRLGCLDTS